jgi:peptide/nickel transport system ATP-binding protein
VNPEPILSLRDWSLDRRGPAGVRTLLSGIDLELFPGRWTAVLGANGSGKSSLLKYLASDESPVAARAAIMFQDPDEQIFATSTGRELALGRPGLDPEPLLGRCGLSGMGSRDPRLLSAGQKQRLVLAVATASEPGVLLCDEPTALQDPRQAAWVLDELDRWRRDSGGALLTATCDRKEAGRADWLVILEDGRILRQGPAGEILATEQARALLGEESVKVPGAFVSTTGEAVLDIRGVGFQFGAQAVLPGPIDLALAPGGRLGITGPNGCGKSTLLAACAGARRPDRGSISLGGKQLYRSGDRDLGHGRALLAPQFPEYLFTRADVAGEIALDPALGLHPGEEFLTMMGLPAGLAGRNPHDLSCGQKRRLALGMVILSGRQVILLDEPTAALDRAGRQRVLGLLDELPPATGLVIASHDTGFLAEAGCAVRELEAP